MSLKFHAQPTPWISFQCINLARQLAWLYLDYLSPPNASHPGENFREKGDQASHRQQNNTRESAVPKPGPSSQTEFAGGGTAPAVSEKRKTAFDQLVLPGGHKKMLLSLIAQHFRDKKATTRRETVFDDQVDIVRGKGTDTAFHSTLPSP